MEDWALIRRLAAEGVPKARIAARLGVSRNTVAKAVASDGPPRYERKPQPTSFTPYEVRVRQLLADTPDMPATVVAERVGWTGQGPQDQERPRTLHRGPRLCLSLRRAALPAPISMA